MINALDMLLRKASLWLPLLTLAISACFGLITLHYFYFPKLSHYNADIKTENLIFAPSRNFLATTLLAVNATPTERWPIWRIPKKHWQIWKINIADFEPTEMERMRTWRHLNPFHRYEVFSHESAETFVKQSFAGKWPKIVNTFLTIKDMIIRADFLRYLILYQEGGVYSDIDTKALRPISTWIPDQFKDKINAVIGLEIDEPGVMWGDWADNFVFCQSTLMVSPEHRIFEIIISNILQRLDDVSKEQNRDIANLELTFQDVLKVTGPVAFTDAVLSYFTEAMGETITRANFTGITMPKHLADVLVLPTVSFVPGQPHSKSGKVEDPEALVQHMGMGSWRATHELEGTKQKEKTDENEKFEQEKKVEEER